MRKPLLVAFSLLVFGLAAMAQKKIDSKWHCAKTSAQQKFDVGDVPGHTYQIAQGTCTATSSNLAEKTGAYTEFDELWKDQYTNHGRFNVTMDNGDMVYYIYEGSGPADMTKPVSNKWKIENGTGKQKGIKGSGACSGTRHDDGSSDWVCSGTYSAGK